MQCLDDDTVDDFVRHAVDASRAAEIEEHLSTCERCRRVVATTAQITHDARPRGRAEQVEDQDSESAATRGIPSRARPTLAAGTRVAQFVTDAVVGVGGAGAVYRAFDTRLERPVALKFARPDHDGGDEGFLLREARTMARLSHPNVVTVYDAGIYGDEVFLAMELVDGPSLAGWLRERQRPWRETLEMFVQAGEGLAAAHAAGLVHGDFKPGNVIVGPDGRPRVTDFGLARRRDGNDEVTHQGGTPAFMAPEHRRGEPPTPQSDQFSFCVSLYLALFGVHPADEAAPSNGADVPPSVRQVIELGLAPDPSARHRSMPVLLAALKRAAGRPAMAGRRRWARTIVLVGGIVAAGTVSAIALVRRSPTTALPPKCGNGVIETSEDCDDGNRSDADGCLTSCRWSRCGDGKVRTHVEECDDGNVVDGDGCTSTCMICSGGDRAFFSPETRRCYTRHDRPLGFEEARQTCQAAGAELIVSQYEKEAIVAQRGLGVTWAESWTGLSRSAEPRASGEGERAQFKWVTNEQVRDELWPANGPNGDGDCVLRLSEPKRGVRWRAAPCAHAAPFVCERWGWFIRLPRNHAYRYELRKVPWQTARAACQALGAYLTTINDAAEQVFLATQIPASVWLGARRESRSHPFTWVTGEPLAFEAFGPPGPGHPGDCLLLGSDRSWRTAMCDKQLGYLCELR